MVLALIQRVQRQSLPISPAVQAFRKMRIVGGREGRQRRASAQFGADGDEVASMFTLAGGKGQLTVCGRPPRHQNEALVAATIRKHRMMHHESSII